MRQSRRVAKVGAALVFGALLAGAPLPGLTGSARGASPAGRVVAWGGSNTPNLVQVPDGLSDVVAVAAGDAESLALKSDGTIVSWGGVAGRAPTGLSNVTAIASGYNVSLALKMDGTVVAWGDDQFGEATVPAGLSDVTAISVDQHCLALRRDGTVVAWGRNDRGQASVPTDLHDVIAVSASFGGSLALKRDGTVVAWGDLLQPWDGLSQVAAIAAGSNFGLVLHRDGKLAIWGKDNLSLKAILTAIPNGVLSGVKAISARGHFVLALKTDGTVVAWGDNQYGQTDVPAHLSGVVAISAGGSDSLALVASPPATSTESEPPVSAPTPYSTLRLASTMLALAALGWYLRRRAAEA
jgi:alpha-tubulin suppressor-like RCC1 family protein